MFILWATQHMSKIKRWTVTPKMPMSLPIARSQYGSQKALSSDHKKRKYAMAKVLIWGPMKAVMSKDPSPELQEASLEN